MKKGYTLIEILAVIGIMGILFGVGYINFRDYQRRKVLSGVTDLIRGDLRLAQSYASSGYKPGPSTGDCAPGKTLDSFSFLVDSTGTKYEIDANCFAGIIHSMTVKTVNLPTGITISIPSPNPLNFKVLGQGTNIDPTSSNPIWTLTVSQQGTSNVTTVTVTSGGQIGGESIFTATAPPTAPPTSPPTAVPTAIPTSTPTAAPTTTAAPTSTPTAAPTTNPNTPTCTGVAAIPASGTPPTLYAYGVQNAAYVVFQVTNTNGGVGLYQYSSNGGTYTVNFADYIQQYFNPQTGNFNYHAYLHDSTGTEYNCGGGTFIITQ